MSLMSNGIGVSDDASIRSLSDIPDDAAGIRFSIDLVSAARKHLSFLRTVADSPWLHQSNTTLLSIRRYDELWMPFVADLMVGLKPPMLLPPLDIQWVWHCHSLNPAKYWQYCESRFSKLVGKPIILDDENEEYALNRCRDLWILRYPSEPFEIEADTTIDIDDSLVTTVTDEDIFSEISKNRSLYSKFSEPYMSEIVYLIAARQRYKGLLYLLQKLGDGGGSSSHLVPTSDILLMWLTHQSYPLAYAGDMKEMEGDLAKLVGVWDSVNGEDIKATKELWEKTFDQPYEKAGATLDQTLSAKSPIYWEISDYDINRKYKSMEPRFLLEVCIFVKSNLKELEKGTKDEFLRLSTIKCHKELRIDEPIVDGVSWRRTWRLYCEFGTKGVVIERRRHGGGFFRRTSTLIDKVVFLWNELLRAPSLIQANEMKHQTEQLSLRVMASITPPVQAPYLLKCVPDRVTDDSGAMISDEILRMNSYRPQEGRWLSRTVLDHAGRDCFVIRIRVRAGFWRRGGETPVSVRWQERIIEIREGSWKYIAGSIGTVPEKVVGTATPIEEKSEAKKASWHLSTGDELTIQWESSSSSPGFFFHLENNNSLEHSEKVRLLRGRKMQYQVSKRFDPERNQVQFQDKDQEDDGANEAGEEEEEEGFVTVVRFSPDNPNGRATALLNWKLLVVELLPEEDAVLVLLLCMVILRSVSEMRREDIGGLLVRRRLKEAKLGTRDWGSVILHPWCTSSCPSFHSPYLLPWYWNAKAVMASADADPASKFNYSPAEGDDKLYKREILF
ncbi:hypothetical protein NE237_015509 [Protea cynaroides]|uniref:GRPD C-terminal domain-containing protein n=1 Tax=Protea cynaroides TaxID=273540 RepID=A0A9Q0KDY0_9MAGN|nr:hypothetical protein NE237_015509 [Protea cynaroides]